MARFLARALMSAALFSGACGAAYADRIAVPRPLVPIAVAPDAVRSPYSVEIVSDGGDVMDTFFHHGRYYVRGAATTAYTVRVTNPTGQRVEAVISVDGLDVIDGENGDLHKRGYIVPAYGEVRIDGWRTSLDNVAAFRFSAVKNSYAGRKGKARNVGVIAVAIFAEDAPAMIVAPPDDDPYYDDDADDGDDSGYGDDVGRYLDHRWHGGAPAAPTGGNARRGGGGDKAERAPAPPPPPSDGPGSAGGGGDGSYGATVTAGAVRPDMEDDEQAASRDRDCCGRAERLGLGTEYGETRYSAASYTRFVRSSDRPVAIAELRYNDDAGLKALGIQLDPEPDATELDTRETANPFPGDHSFARPPAGIR